MPNYANSRIYKLTCNVTGLMYVGSTTQPLYKRKHQHKEKYEEWLKGRYHYVTSFKIIEGGDYDIVLIEEVQCENKEQLHRKEREWIELMDCVNKCVPTRTNKEYYEQNKQEILVQRKEYREQNKEDLLKKQKEYYEQNKEQIATKRKEVITCSCGTEHARHGKARHIRSIKHIQWEQSQLS